LLLATSSIEANVAGADSRGVVALPATRAITPSFVAVAVHRIRTRRALHEVARGATVSFVANTPNMLHRIPRRGVRAGVRAGEMLLGPALTSAIAVIWANSTLASNTAVSSETLASARLAITRSLVGALHNRVQVIRAENIAYPGLVLRACAQRAVRASPLILAVDSLVAHAVSVHLAHTMARASVLAVATLTMSLFSVPNDLAPGLRLESGSGSRSTIRDRVVNSKCSDEHHEK